MDAVVDNAAADVPARGSLRQAFGVWARVSLAGIGGPALQIATMHRLLVQQKRWISEDRLFHALSYCIALPGPETQQLAIYVGWLAHRTIGGVIAGSLFILPGAICMMALSIGYVTGGDSPFGQALFLGIRPAILAVMAEAIIRFGRHVLHSDWMRVIAGAAFLAAFVRVSFPLIILVAAFVGTSIALLRWPGLVRPAAAADSWQAERVLPDHARPSVGPVARTLTFWLVLWLAPPIVLLALLGPANIYTQISILFGKVAVMAIGGDYAVVAYSAPQVVDAFRWVSPKEMQEAVAMGEMVPGTIMIVTQFLGFIAAYRDPGALPPLVAAMAGGLLASWMTFCPCFLWIMVIAPFLQGLHRNTFLNSALQAVTAAAVGMILNLSVWFGIRTLFHSLKTVHYPPLSFDVPVFASVNVWALALFGIAAVAVLRFRIGAAPTLAVSSAVGVLLFLIGITG